MHIFFFSFLFWERIKLILNMFRGKSGWMRFLNDIGNTVFAGAYNSCLNHFFKRKKKKKDVKRIVCQEIVGCVCIGASKERPPAVFVSGGWATVRKVRWLSGLPLLYCAAPSLPGLACSGLEWIKQAVGKVPLICITSRQPCRTLCWQEITVFVTFSQGPPFGRDGPCDHA